MLEFREDLAPLVSLSESYKSGFERVTFVPGIAFGEASVLVFDCLARLYACLRLLRPVYGYSAIRRVGLEVCLSIWGLGLASFSYDALLILIEADRFFFLSF